MKRTAKANPACLFVGVVNILLDLAGFGVTVVMENILLSLSRSHFSFILQGCKVWRNDERGYLR